METSNKTAFEAYAIFKTGGKQYQAIPGKTIQIEKIEGEAGDKVSFSEVLFKKVADGKFEFGKPFIKGASLNCSIVKQLKGPKLVIFRHKRRKKQRTKKGHRQLYTVIRVDSI